MVLNDITPDISNVPLGIPPDASSSGNPCECKSEWTFKGKTYKGCSLPPGLLGGKPWCYINGDSTSCTDDDLKKFQYNEYPKFFGIGPLLEFEDGKTYNFFETLQKCIDACDQEDDCEYMAYNTKDKRCKMSKTKNSYWKD